MLFLDLGGFLLCILWIAASFFFYFNLTGLSACSLIFIIIKENDLSIGCLLYLLELMIQDED
jgi:hypothetical protein